MISAPNEVHPYRFGRIILLAIEEILGVQEADDLLGHARLSQPFKRSGTSNAGAKFQFKYILRLQNALEEAYGSRAGAGFCLRIGRASLKYFLREFGPQLGITSLDFRLLPLPKRLKAGSEALAKLLTLITDLQVMQTTDSEQVCWKFEYGALFRERQGREYCCTLISGLLQEAFCWMSGGRSFLVQERHDLAGGILTCAITIDQTPLG
jgi:hypothetical protein